MLRHLWAIMSYQKLQNCYICIIGDCTITKKRKVTALTLLSFLFESNSRIIYIKNHKFYL